MLSVSSIEPAPRQPGRASQVWREIKAVRARFCAAFCGPSDAERRALAAQCGVLRECLLGLEAQDWRDVAAKVEAVLAELDDGHEPDDWHREMLRRALDDMQRLNGHDPSYRCGPGRSGLTQQR